MRKFKRAGQLSRLGMWALLALALTACPQRPQVILQDSAAMRIQPGDLPKSPGAKGWLLSDQAAAKLLEAAEACKKK